MEFQYPEHHNEDFENFEPDWLHPKPQGKTRGPLDNPNDPFLPENSPLFNNTPHPIQNWNSPLNPDPLNLQPKPLKDPKDVPPTPETEPPSNPFKVPLNHLAKYVGSAHDTEEEQANTPLEKTTPTKDNSASGTPHTQADLPGLPTSGGSALSQDIKDKHAPHLKGQNLDDVQMIHAPEHVQYVGSKAFTVGNRIYYDQADPTVTQHEVKHVVDRKIGRDRSPEKLRRWAKNDNWLAEQAARDAERRRKAAEAEARRKAEAERKRKAEAEARAKAEAERKRAELIKQRKEEARKRRDAERLAKANQPKDPKPKPKPQATTEEQHKLLKVQQSQDKEKAIWKDLPPDVKQTKIALDAKKSLYDQWLDTSNSVLGKGDKKGLEEYFSDNARTLKTLEWMVKSTQKPTDSFQAKRYKDYLAPTGNPSDKVALVALKQDSLKTLVNQETPEGQRVSLNGPQVVRAITKTDAQGKPVTEYFVKAGGIETWGNEEKPAQWVKIKPPTQDQVMVSVDATEMTQGKQSKELNSVVNISGGESKTKKRYNVIDQNYQDHINPTFTQYQQLRGDAPRQLSGSSLRNELGVAMNFTPNNVPLNDAEKKALKDGNWDLFSPDKISPELAQSMTPQQQEKFREQLKQQHEQLIKVEEKVKKIGGDNAKVTTLPIMIDSPELGGVMQVPLFRVTGKDGKDRFVDNTGREYDDFKDWKDNNKLPPGRVSYFADGQISSKPDGQPNVITENSHAVKDTAWEHIKPWLDGAALVGGIALGVAAIVFSGGTATPAVAAAAMAWGGAGLAAYGLANGGATLYDRYDHGESLSLADEQARAAWLEVAGSAAGFAAIRASMRATSAMTRVAGSVDDVSRAANVSRATRLGRTATGVNAVSDATDVLGLTDSTYGLAKNWENMSPEQRLMAVGQIGFWGGMMGAGKVREHGLSQNNSMPEGVNPYASGEVDQYMQSVGAGARDEMVPGSQVLIPGESVEQRVTRRAREQWTEGEPTLDELIAMRMELKRQQEQEAGTTTPETETTTPEDVDPKTGKPLKLSTGSEVGKAPDSLTIKEGSVKMEEHPQYANAVDKVNTAGFTIKMTKGDPHVAVKEIVDSNGNLIRVEKELYVQPGMRYLDLEHEIGHIQQLERFGEHIPPTERLVERPDGRLTDAPNQDGVLTTWQDPILEYHNRLQEYLRLQERGASKELLEKHSTGIEEWAERYVRKGLKGGRSPSRNEWAEKYFPDISELQNQYKEVTKKE